MDNMEELDKEKIIEYSNKLLSKIDELLEEEKKDEDIKIDEFILALSSIIPQKLLEEVTDKKMSLLEVNQKITRLLFELK